MLLIVMLLGEAKAAHEVKLLSLPAIVTAVRGQRAVDPVSCWSARR